MADASIIISADTKALMRSLSAVVDELREVKDAVSAGAEAMGDSFGEAARQVEAAGEAVAKTTAGIGDQLSEQTKMAKALGEEQAKAVKALGEEQSKAAKAIASALENQSRQQKDANAALSEQKELLAQQEKEIGKVTAAVEKNGSAWQLALQGFAIKAASAALDLLGRIASSGLEAGKVFDDMSAKLSAYTGSIETARAKFWELNALEDRTAIATDELAAAYIELSNRGLNSTSAQLERYSAIAQGTDRDVTQLAKAIGNFTDGETEALKEFGITAERSGNQMTMSFRGQQTTIDATAAALEEYLAGIADSDFAEVLGNRTATVTASFERLDNAWGTLTARIMDGTNGVGVLIRTFTDLATDSLNGLADLFASPKFGDFFDGLSENLKLTGGEIGNFCEDAADLFKGGFDLIVTREKDAIGSMSSFLSQFFSWSRTVLLDFFKNLDTAVTKSSSWVTSTGDFLGDLLFGATHGEKDPWGHALGTFEDSLANRNKGLADRLKAADDEIKLTLKEIDDAQSESEAKAAEFAAKREELAAREAGAGREIRQKGGSGGSSAGRGTSSGAGSAARELERAQTQARELYVRLTQDLSAGEAAALENDLTRLNDYYSRRLLTDEQYQEARKALEADAAAFLTSLNPREAELQRIRDEYDAKLELLREYHEKQLISEQEFRQGLANISAGYYDRAGKADGKGAEGGGKENKNDFFNDKELKNIDEMEKGLSSLSSTISGMTSNLDESRAAYKAMFAAQKSFAMASATLNAIVAWTAALSDAEELSWYGKLAKYAQAVALTGNILSQLASVTMHDKGGRIGPGALGIVGEYGPELVRGPAAVTSRKDTADLLAGAGRGVSVQVNLIEDSSRAGAVDTHEDDEQTVIDICVANIRRGGALADAMANTYNLARVGM